MKYLVLGLVAACSSPHHASPDAGGHVGDALIDASVDAPVSDDLDGDGVPNGVDDCPTVYDPAQVDPDHDGVGWACDSLEHFDIAAHSPTVFPGKLVGQTFALHVVSFDGQGNHTDIAAQIDLSGFGVGRTDSTLAADAWLSDSQVTGPCITGDQRVWWSRRDHLETGTRDTVTGQFSPLAAQTIATCSETNGATSLFGLTDSNAPAAQVIPTTFAVPVGATLPVLASAPLGFSAQGQPGVRVTTAPPIITLTAETGVATSSLVKENPGDLATTDVIVDGAPATDLDEVVPLDVPLGYETAPVASYCVRRGANVYHAGIAQSATTWTSLPFSACPTASTLLAGSKATFLRGTHAAGTTTIARIVDGQATTVFDNEPGDALSAAYAGGDDLQTVMVHEGTTTKVWAVASSSVLIASTPTDASTSTYRDTAHVLEIVPTTGGMGDLVLVRYRAATGREQFTIQTGVPTYLTYKVVTTAEGGAIVGGSGQVFALGRTSTAVTLLGAAALDFGAARGDTTVVFARTTTSTFQSRIYAYDELGGTPRITALTANIDANVPFVLDPYVGAPTDWFTYGVVCSYGHIVYSGTVPALQSAANCQAAGRVVGRTTAGIPVFISTGLVALLKPTGPETVMHFNGLVPIIPIFDFKRATPPVIGWYGAYADPTILNGFTSCLASHPDHCWRHHSSSISQVAADADTDTFSIMTFGDLNNGQYRVEIIRAIDGGVATQPL